MNELRHGTLVIWCQAGKAPMYRVVGEDTSWRVMRKSHGQQLASERENLIALGVDPNDLEIPL